MQRNPILSPKEIGPVIDKRRVCLFVSTKSLEYKVYRAIFRSPHPNLVKVFKIVKISKMAIVVMERLKPLQRKAEQFFDDLVERDGSLVPFDDIESFSSAYHGKAKTKELQRLNLQIYNGCKHLHDLGFNHRDVHGSNVLLRGRTPVLIDFDVVSRKKKEKGNRK